MLVNAEIIGCDLPQAAPQEFQVLELGIDQDVGREHLVAGDEAPDVDVVDQTDALHLFHLAAEPVPVDVFGYPLEQHVHDFSDQTPGAEQNKGADDHAHDGVRMVPVEGPHQQARHDDADGSQQIRP